MENSRRDSATSSFEREGKQILDSKQLHSSESMHVIVSFSALSLNVLINFDNEIIISRGKETIKGCFVGQNLNSRQKHDHAKAICSRNAMENDEKLRSIW
jgi:hypothetical protein